MMTNLRRGEPGLEGGLANIIPIRLARLWSGMMLYGAFRLIGETVTLGRESRPTVFMLTWTRPERRFIWNDDGLIPFLV